MADLRTPTVFTTAAEVCEHAALEPRALRLLSDDLSPGAFVRLLDEQRLHIDAIRFIGMALPGRKAVWWACTCVRHTAEALAPAEREALGAAVYWVLEPGLERVASAKSALRDVGLDTPGGAVALAATKVMRAPVAAGRASAGAVFMAATRGQGQTPAQLYRQFVALGLEVDGLAEPWKREAH